MEDSWRGDEEAEERAPGATDTASFLEGSRTRVVRLSEDTWAVCSGGAPATSGASGAS